jgi:hypothetical protein
MPRGPNNLGALVPASQDRALAQGILVNGLPMTIRSYPAAYVLDDYLSDCIASMDGHGPGRAGFDPPLT